MVTFIVSVVLLVVGYALYGRLMERAFKVDPQRVTPAYELADGVDYVPMPWWKIFLIQFLNIAGLGPIFGAIMGAMFGPAAFLWIVFGSIFGGAVHDYLSGMMSVRSGGASLPELVGAHLGGAVKQFMRVFSVLLLLMVGAVFVSGPAGLLAGMVEGVSYVWWIVIVFVYYMLATLLPIDKVIGKVYPLFGVALLFMAVGVLVMMFVNRAPIPEVTDGLASHHAAGYPLFPMMFVSIACGAVSGFHATQSPMMARCIQNERYGRPCFYGAMIAEGVVALIWAAAAASFFGSVEGLQEYAASLPATTNKAAEVVSLVANTWLGRWGGMLALVGVVAAPITTGDTALRSARLIVADFLKLDQHSIARRLMVSVPIFAVSALLLCIDFEVLWRYFAWSNQMLAVFTLWTIAVFLYKENRAFHCVAVVPALFMTAVCSSYIVVAPEGLGLALGYGYAAAALACCVLLALFARFARIYDAEHRRPTPLFGARPARKGGR